MSLKHILSMNECCAFWSGPSRRRSWGDELPWAPRRLGAPPSLKNIKYALFLKKSRIFSKEGPRENVFPGPAVALDEPDSDQLIVNAAVSHCIHFGHKFW